MLWCRVVWRGVVWCVAWCGMVCCVVWFGVAGCGGANLVLACTGALFTFFLRSSESTSVSGIARMFVNPKAETCRPLKRVSDSAPAVAVHLASIT